MSSASQEYRDLLWQCLIESGWSQNRLSELSGVGPVTLNKILNGRRPATELQVIRLALPWFLSSDQTRFLNRHLDSAEYYMLPVNDDDGPGILLPGH